MAKQPSFLETVQAIDEILQGIDKTCRVLRAGDNLRRELAPGAEPVLEDDNPEDDEP